MRSRSMGVEGDTEARGVALGLWIGDFGFSVGFVSSEIFWGGVGGMAISEAGEGVLGSIGWGLVGSFSGCLCLESSMSGHQSHLS